MCPCLAALLPPHALLCAFQAAERLPPRMSLFFATPRERLPPDGHNDPQFFPSSFRSHFRLFFCLELDRWVRQLSTLTAAGRRSLPPSSKNFNPLLSLRSDAHAIALGIALSDCCRCVPLAHNPANPLDFFGNWRRPTPQSPSGISVVVLGEIARCSPFLAQHRTFLSVFAQGFLGASRLPAMRSDGSLFLV